MSSCLLVLDHPSYCPTLHETRRVQRRLPGLPTDRALTFGYFTIHVSATTLRTHLLNTRNKPCSAHLTPRPSHPTILAQPTSFLLHLPHQHWPYRHGIGGVNAFPSPHALLQGRGCPPSGAPTAQRSNPDEPRAVEQRHHDGHCHTSSQ